MKKFFDLLKKIFNVSNLDELDEAMIDSYYANIEEVPAEPEVKEEVTEEVKEDEVVNAAPETEKPADTEEVTPVVPVEEVKEDEVKEETPVEKVKETEEVKTTEEVAETEKENSEEEKVVIKENKEDDVIDEEVVNKALNLNTKTFDKDYLNNLHGDEFFKVLRSNPNAVKDAYRG